MLRISPDLEKKTNKNILLTLKHLLLKKGQEFLKQHEMKAGIVFN